jgi:hypothetical protein
VVTPISPVGWKLIFDGETVTLSPSVGSWDFPCRSHYFIRHDTVVWGADMSREEIEWGRARDRNAPDEHFGNKTSHRQKRNTKWFWDRFKS